MDANDQLPRAPQPTSSRRGPRRILTYALLGGAAATLLGALGVHRQGRASAATSPAVRPGPFAAVPMPAPAPTPPTSAPAPEAPPAPVVQGPIAPVTRPRVELVFALDTTGSMSGLIDGAKQKIWSIASFIAQGQPTPDLRVGLVGYRDIGDEYVTRVFDLDQDLDRVYKRLRGFSAGGGGDGPEHVARALDDSVRKMSWSQAPQVVRIIYLVGDAPPHTDYDDGYDYASSARAAARKGIQVHTIQCGADSETAGTWRKIAALGHGQFMTIQQDGGVLAERSRWDDELGRLHDKLAGTTVAYGAAGAAAVAANREALAAPAPIKAARAGYMASKGKAIAGSGDLVDAINTGETTLEKVQADLPPEMRAMDREKQAAYVATKWKERSAINQQIAELSRRRRAELDASEAAAAKAGARDGFDVAAKKALRKSVEDNTLSGLKL